MGKVHDGKILTTSGFKFNANAPLDDRQVVQAHADLNDILAYEGIEVYVVEETKSYKYIAGNWVPIATEDYVNNKISENDLRIEDDGAGNVTFESGAPTEIFVTDVQQTTGQSTTAVMSQKAVTDEIDTLKGDLSDLAPTGAQIGQLFRTAAISEDGKYTMEPVDMLDVQVNGASIVTDGVANLKASTHNGIGFNTAGFYVANCTSAQINNRSTSNQPLTPMSLDYAVKTAMCDGKGAAWTADEQKAARERIGSEQWDLICDVELMEQATEIFVEKDINGNSFELEKVYMEQYVPLSNKSGQTALEFNLPKDTSSQSFFLITVGGMSTTENKTSRGFVHKIANTWFTHSLQGTGPVYAWSVAAIYSTTLSVEIEKYPNIYNLTFKQLNGGILPVGTTLKVWGVKK